MQRRVSYACVLFVKSKMKRRAVSSNYTNRANDKIVRINGIVITICSAGALFIADDAQRTGDAHDSERQAMHKLSYWRAEQG
jgi:hypothetical protein